MSPGAAASQGSGKPFWFLRIPRIERDSGTLHTVIAGHELGHLRDWTYGLRRLPPPISVPNQWLDPAGSIQIQYLPALQRFASVASAWAGEIVADVVAGFMFGPASLQALSELVGTLGMWAVDSATHPGTDRRAAIIVDLLSQAGFAAVPDVAVLLNHFTTETGGALTRPVDIDRSPYPESDQAAWELLMTKLPALVAVCDNAIQTDERFVTADWTFVTDAERRLSAGQPCGERFDSTGNPVPESDAVILNAAYLVKSKTLADLGSVLGLDTGDPPQASQAAAVLDELVLKSFEVAEHRRRTPWK